MKRVINKCDFQNVCQLICCSVNCHNNPFRCNVNNCQCNQSHSNCKDKKSYTELKKGLDQKISKNTVEKKQLISEIKETYHRIQKLLTIYYQEFTNWVGTIGLNKIQTLIFKALNGQSEEILTGNLIYQYNQLKSQQKHLQEKAKQKHLQNNTFKNQNIIIIKSMTKIFEEIQLAYKSKFQNHIISNLILSNSIDSKIINEKEAQILIKILNQQKKLGSKMSAKSEEEYQMQLQKMDKINKHYSDQYAKKLENFKQQWSYREEKFLKQINQLKRQLKQRQSIFGCLLPKNKIEKTQPQLINFKLDPNIELYRIVIPKLKETAEKIKKKKPKSIKLLYRASQNKFNTNIFWTQCNKKSNTLILLRTEYNQIIGGFTPLKWNKDKDQQFQHDLSKQSFLFSLTLEQKIRLDQKEKAIYSNIDDGPIFGRDDLHIYDKADKSENNQAYIGNSYVNKQLFKNKDQVYKFCGNPTGTKFKIIQWEVFQVQFNEQYETIKIE